MTAVEIKYLIHSFISQKQTKRKRMENLWKCREMATIQQEIY